jgi:RHS repeat-associated protein
VNKYYETNLTTGENTTYYYLGDRLVAMRAGTTLDYIHQDHLTGTSVVSDSSGNLVNSVRYSPYGECRNSQGTLGTDKLFTGQRLDSTGLYYYNARYYDPTIGRFISADPLLQWSSGLDFVSYQLTVNVIPLGLGSAGNLQVSYPQAVLAVPVNPQALNRYSYVLNNPLRYTDPTGYQNWRKVLGGVVIIIAVDLFLATPITLVAIASYLTPPVAPALTAVAAAVDIFAIATTIYSLHLIEEGLSEDSDQKTPQLPIEKEPSTSAPLTSPSGDTTPSQPTPDSSVLVTFSDGSSGYFTPEEVGAMLEEGAPIVSIE